MWNFIPALGIVDGAFTYDYILIFIACRVSGDGGGVYWIHL